MKAINLVGNRFGRLLVLERRGSSAAGEARWLCACDCGNHHEIGSGALRRGRSHSCGCLSRELAAERASTMAGRHLTTHRATRTPEWNTWTGMKQRCSDTNTEAWPHYGGRGIRVCDEWLHDFPAFLAHVGPKPSRDHSIDRIDVNGHYEPGNVRWATRIEQAQNKRHSVRT